MPEKRSNNVRARARGAKHRKAPLPFLIPALEWTRHDAVAFVVGIVAVVAVLVNGLFMQSGSHPAPLFSPAGVEKAAQPTAKLAQAAPLPKMDAAPTPAMPKPAAPNAPRTPVETITDVQRELGRRGYYDGPVDGLYGPRTDGAVRDFERAAGLKPSAQPTEALLQAIKRSPFTSGNGGDRGSAPRALGR
jgi:hypothetical protein